MKTLKTLEPLITTLLEIQRINSAASVLSWDQETYMPAGGGSARAEQIATLQGIAHKKLVSPDTERLLGSWLDLGTGQPLEHDGDLWDESSRALLREVWRDYSRAKKLPSDFVMTMSRECSLAQQVWIEAKDDHDFKRFLPNLRNGLYSIQGQIDLHGLTRAEARITVEDFIVRLARFPSCCVKIIHGRGINSRTDTPVLKENLQRWLSTRRMARPPSGYFLSFDLRPRPNRRPIISPAVGSSWAGVRSQSAFSRCACHRPRAVMALRMRPASAFSSSSAIVRRRSRSEAMVLSSTRSIFCLFNKADWP